MNATLRTSIEETVNTLARLFNNTLKKGETQASRDAEILGQASVIFEDSLLDENAYIRIKNLAIGRAEGRNDHYHIEKLIKDEIHPIDYLTARWKETLEKTRPQEAKNA